jgi:nucleoside-diphosphate-sugar epimerase
MRNANDDFKDLRDKLFEVTSKPWDPASDIPPPDIRRATLVQNFIDSHNIRELGFWNRRDLDQLIKEFKDNQTADSGIRNEASIDRGKGPEKPKGGWFR